MKIRISHIDLDGAIPMIIDQFYGIECDKFINENYGDLAEKEYLENATEDDVFIYTDFTPEGECIDLIRDKKLHCVIIDHHESSKENIDNLVKDNPNVKYIYDVNKCGTSLYYDYVINELGKKENQVLKELCHYTEVYDLWKKDDTDWIMAQDINRLMWKQAKWYKKDDFAEMHKTFMSSLLWKCNNANKFFFSAMELEKINLDKKEEKELFEFVINPKNGLLKTRQDNEGKYFCVIQISKKISIICNLLLEKFKKLDYVIAINTYDKENPKISVRSRDLNLLEYDGFKGHENACGVETPTMEFCNNLWEGKVYCFNKIKD